MKRMWIDGKWTDSASGQTIQVTDPATEEVLDVVPAGTPEDVGLAVAAAKNAFPSWRLVTAVERAQMLHQAAAKMRTHFDELARLLTLEEGKPLPENEEEIDWSLNTLDYYAELGRHIRGRVLPSPDVGQLSLVLKEPYGVVGCIVPWNYPILLLVWKLAPALAAGNTVVVKPASLTPLATLRMVEVAFDHFPPGVVNVVTGRGGEIGDALVTHPDVPVIAFTGSTAVGQHIARVTAGQMKKLHLELGGKDPFVIADDAPLEPAVEAVAYAALINAGQVCTSTERVYVPRSMAAQFGEALAERVSRLRLGPGIEPTTDVGPMIGESYRSTVEEHVADAVAKGARVLVGGRRPPHLERGCFYEPAVLVDVDHSMRIMREETFGPTIPIMAYDTFDEAIGLANDTEYGLGACLYTHDARKVRRFYEEVQAGTVWINDPLTDNYAGPFGGMKMSGLGRELGVEGLEEFWQTKHVHWDIEGGMKEWWYPY
ncbi:MAG: aldehyde dehydrogenase family protein [Chloroflexi bacterium]|nr:aldehyde dehydrogenase family protein [Chloroflexota bacterium]